MSKIIELTLEIEVQKVSCPGVWLCQDGYVRLTICALGTTYHTCLLPPVFPLLYRDVFYFKKQFIESCALNNICCLLKDETIYCELVQWCEGCKSKQYVILARYLGALNDVLFPPNMCKSDGVDLLMRRSQNFPGILSPKIEIATKVRVDEVLSSRFSSEKIDPCECRLPQEDNIPRNKVCHSAGYHRHFRSTSCYPEPQMKSRSRSQSRLRSKSYCSEILDQMPMRCYINPPSYRSSCYSPHRYQPTINSTPRCRKYCVYKVKTANHYGEQSPFTNIKFKDYDDDNAMRPDSKETDGIDQHNDDRIQRALLESRYIDNDNYIDTEPIPPKVKIHPKKSCLHIEVNRCVCEICTRYHQLFHS